MTQGAGPGSVVDEVVQPAPPPAVWKSRLKVALGGATVLLALLLLAQSWFEGVRPSSFVQLRQDISDGSVTQWYVANGYDHSRFQGIEIREVPVPDLTQPTAAATPSSSPTLEVPATPAPDASVSPETDDSVVQGDEVDSGGALIVWRSSGHPGWFIADSDVLHHPSGSLWTSGGSPQVDEIVRQLQAAQVPMLNVVDDTIFDLESFAPAFGLLLLIVLTTGRAPRLGTRWFWFWMILIAPLHLGVIAYAVSELIGLGREWVPRSGKRFSGAMGFLMALGLSLLIAKIASGLRSAGLPLPL